MANYKEALNAGFAAARKAEIARKEVSGVMEKFKNDILEASEGKLLIEIRTFEEIPEQIPGFPPVNAWARALGIPKKYYQALCALNPKNDTSSLELALWNQSKDGYPCKLTWGKQEIQCENRAGLEEGLAQLLSDPVIGEKLYSLTKPKTN